MTETETVPADGLAAVMARSVRFVMLRRGGLPGYYKVPEAHLRLGDSELDKETFVGGSLRAMPKEWTAKFNAVVGKAEAAVREAAPPAADDIPAVIPGVSVVRAGRVEDLGARVAKVAAEDFRPLVSAFAAAYPAILEDIKAKVTAANPAAWGPLSRRLPTQVDIVTRARLALEEIPISFVGEAGRNVAEQFALQVVGGLASSLEDTVVKLADKVAAGGVFKDGSFTELRRQFTLMREFDFLASAEQKATLAAAEKAFSALGDDPHKTLNASMKSSAKEVVKGLTGVLDALAAECRKDAGGRFRRAIDLD